MRTMSIEDLMDDISNVEVPKTMEVAKTTIMNTLDDEGLLFAMRQAEELVTAINGWMEESDENIGQSYRELVAATEILTIINDFYINSNKEG